jgi:hypothetical protein
LNTGVRSRIRSAGLRTAGNIMRGNPSPEFAQVVEEFLRRWLRQSDLGEALLARLSEPAAMGLLYELLNAGYAKLALEPDGLGDIELHVPPQPPARWLWPPRFLQ